ncbi:MAG: Lrp/AsnC family transcriptional regulator [Cellvibrionaceae bacterium]
MRLNNIDIRILNELQRDADQTNLALAEKVGLSAPACLKRVQKLKASGVIERVVAIVSPQAVGKRLNMIVEIEMKEDNPSLDKQFMEALTKAIEVKQCYQVTGQVDFVLVVNVADIFEYESFCQKTLYSHNNMKKFTTLISIRCTKFDLCQHALT